MEQVAAVDQALQVADAGFKHRLVQAGGPLSGCGVRPARLGLRPGQCGLNTRLPGFGRLELAVDVGAEQASGPRGAVEGHDVRAQPQDGIRQPGALRGQARLDGVREAEAQQANPSARERGLLRDVLADERRTSGKRG